MHKGPASSQEPASSLDRVASIFSWWGLSQETDPERCKARLAVLQAFVSDLQELFREASARQTDAVARANEKLATAAARVATARDPPGGRRPHHTAAARDAPRQRPS